MPSVAAEPYGFDFEVTSTALLVIDMQRDFVDPGGFGEALGNDVSLLRRAVAPTRRVLDAARAAGMLVVHTREGHRPDLSDCPPSKRARGHLQTGIGDHGPMGRILVRGEYGHDIVDELTPHPGEPIVDKPGKGAFYATDLEFMLRNRGITSLIVTGVTAEVCVQTTVREANDRGLDCLVLEDCIASYFPEFYAMTIRMVKAQGGIFGWVAPSEAFLAVLPVRVPGMNAVVRRRDIALWVPGDWNAFFGLFTNVLLNVLVLTSLVLTAVKLPDEIVFGRILPALGIALPLGNLWYAYLAYQMARRDGRTDVTAMPYGPSVPHMFIVVFAVMLPIYLSTNDPIRAWQAGLAWCAIIGVIILVGAFVGPAIRKHTPRAAMLGSLAGISLAFISLRPAFQSWDVPWIAFVSLTLVLIGWTAGVRLPGNMPAGLAAVIVGTALGWATGVMHAPDVAASLSQVGFHPPLPSGDVLVGFGAIAGLLATAIPLGIYNFTEAMNNVESASAAGDEYPLRSILLADGIGAIAGSFLGSPFPPAVYIGHPGWKAVGGRIGYSLATGACVAVVCWLGLTGLLLAIIPLVAILPILLYIGLVIGAQAFQVSPTRHAPAIVLAMLPNIANWGQNQVQTALATAGTVVIGPELSAKLSDAGAIVYHGMVRFGGGATLAGLMLGAIAVFIIDREFRNATIFAVGAAVLSFFGLIHGEQVGIGVNLDIVVGYLLMAGLTGYLAVRKPAEAAEPEEAAAVSVATTP